MKFPSNAILAILLCLLHACKDNTANPLPPWQASALATTQKGLAWLAQNEVDGKGYWADPKFPAMTGLVLLALTGAPGHDPAQVDRAVAYIVSCAQPDGGIYIPNPVRKGGGLGNYNTAICMTALHAARPADPAINKLVLNARAFIAASQLTGDGEYAGGFGYDRENQREYTDLMNTHFALEAMRRTQSLEDARPAGQKHADIDWPAALAYVARLQNSHGDDAGGFFYNPTDAKAGTRTTDDGTVILRSYGSITYAGLLSMVYANLKPHDPRVRSAVDYATRHWTLDENPGMGQEGLYFYFNVMSRALTASRLPSLQTQTGDTIHWQQQLAQRLAALQRPDGSWSNPNNRFWENDPSLATAYALIALQLATNP